MSIRKALLSLSVGLFLAVFVIGLLPFLVIISWAETLGSTELYTSPLFFLKFFLYKDSCKEQSQHREEGH